MARENRPVTEWDEDPEDPDVARERTTRGGRERSSRWRGRRRPRGGDIFLISILVIAMMVFFLVDPNRLFGLLYSGTAGLILLVMVVEFLVLKSMDRTRVYQMESFRLREQRRHDRALLRRVCDLLEEADELAGSGDPNALIRWKTKAEVAASEIRERL